MLAKNPIKNQDAKDPGVKSVVTRGLIGVHPDAKDHMQSSEYTGKGLDENSPVAKGLMTKGSANSPAAKCMNAKDPGCM
jgi:hypothetical protein